MEFEADAAPESPESKFLEARSSRSKNMSPNNSMVNLCGIADKVLNLGMKRATAISSPANLSGIAMELEVGKCSSDESSRVPRYLDHSPSAVLSAPMAPPCSELG